MKEAQKDLERRICFDCIRAALEDSSIRGRVNYPSVRERIEEDLGYILFALSCRYNTGVLRFRHYRILDDSGRPVRIQEKRWRSLGEILKETGIAKRPNQTISSVLQRAIRMKAVAGGSEGMGEAAGREFHGGHFNLVPRGAQTILAASEVHRPTY